MLALPFTTLRDVDLGQAGLRPVTRQAIDELGLGANAKLHLGMSRRPWVEQGYGGAVYTGVRASSAAGTTRPTSPCPGACSTSSPGGSQVSRAGRARRSGVPTAAQVQGYLAQVEPIFPGTTAAYTGCRLPRLLVREPVEPRGAYTAQRPGQYTRVFGAGSTPEGSIHFAGEHTSTDYFGFLNGAVESGRACGQGHRPVVSGADAGKASQKTTSGE